MRRARATPAVLALLLVGCGAAVPIGDWRATAVDEHPLAGRIWSTDEARFITPEALRARLAAARVVLLGEKHDNPDHHRLHGWLLDGLAGPPVPVLFEQLDLDDAEAIAGAADPEALRAAAGWDRSGWPDFALYAPKFAPLYRLGAPVRPAHPPRAAVRASMTKPLDAYPFEMGLDRPLPEAAEAGLRGEIERSHCGHADPALVEGMLRAQRFKDATMARALSAAAGREGRAVLVAGNGHVRRDVGVPFYLPAIPTVSVGVLEVRRGAHDPPRAAARFDYVWFTPRVDEIDPCVKFAEQLRRIEAARPPPPPASQPANQPAGP